MGAHSYRIVLPFSQEKVLPNGAKNKLICENAIAWAKYGSCTHWVMGSWLY